jgi:hypothetical protein
MKEQVEEGAPEGATRPREPSFILLDPDDPSSRMVFNGEHIDPCDIPPKKAHPNPSKPRKKNPWCQGFLFEAQ